MPHKILSIVILVGLIGVGIIVLSNKPGSPSGMLVVPKDYKEVPWKYNPTVENPGKKEPSQETEDQYTACKERARGRLEECIKDAEDDDDHERNYGKCRKKYKKAKEKCKDRYR